MLIAARSSQDCCARATASAGYVEHNRRWVAQAGALDEAYGHSPADIGSAPARGAKVE